jgi:radical SAM superfamily enzyme YgiQ (UPF0313 family)
MIGVSRDTPSGRAFSAFYSLKYIIEHYRTDLDMDINYDYPLYRPPSEANSLILQVTLGCSFNRCSFCNMYRTKEYQERPWDDLKAEIDILANEFPEATRVFLADGDALNLPTDKLLRIINYLHFKFPNLSRVASYAMPKNIFQKSDEDMESLRNAGLAMLYLGIETGNDIILKKITKGATGKGILNACQKARSHNFILSCMIILGLGGRTYTLQHIADTARLVSIASPDYLAALNLQIEEAVQEEFVYKFGEPFVPLEDVEILDELHRLVAQINPRSPIIFRANHASNVYSMGGSLPADKDKLLLLIEGLKASPSLLKPKILRRF